MRAILKVGGLTLLLFTFSRSGWSVISASLAKEGTSKKETITTPPQSSDSEQ
jgi:hypothetical protein